ncbi:type II secretion system F family protein [Dermatobacter hominis]|uniref:type II secretion system F family protein n=1 Tax=Dermatobacter hominis TaxID=2884263 RepID=UPI001D127492|nr:type II secretion system F family protein [Dermatobacter hominis]UDY37964.1 type II secretion system F family protein [Dermatobacter hominis]
MTATQPQQAPDDTPSGKPKRSKKDRAAKVAPVKLSKFKYQAETLDGQVVKGQIQSVSANTARNELAVQGLRVTELTEKKGLQVEITTEKVPAVDLMHFSRQMATFLRAGVPVTEAIDNLRRDSDNKKLQSVLGDVLERVQGGRSLADALGLHDEVFPPYYMAMLRSAELTGRMDEAFDQLHKYLRRDVELTRAVRKALIYPCILLGLSVVVCLIIVIFAIPRFADFFKEFDAELPLPTRMLMGVADFVQSPAGIITGILLVALGFGLFAYVRTPNGRRNFHALQLKIPMISTVVTYSSTERFCRVLGALLEAGTPLAEALPTAIDCSNNSVYKERLSTAMEGVLAGQGFAEPLASTELFPNTVIQMVRVGERSGELSEQLDNAAGFYEEELDYAVEKLTAWFEPLTIIFIGAVVGFVALAMVSAMYGIYNQVDLG